LTIAGLLPDGVGTGAMAVMDIGWVQELYSNAGRLTSIQILLQDPSQIGKARDALASQLPPDAVVQAPEQRSQQVQRMLDGFQLNITALSMVSILVGVFLIYNSVSASVVRRRREIGILRSTGASPKQVRGVFLAEGLFLGIPGVLLGIPLGTLLAGMLIGDVSQTISSHYILVNATQITVASRDVLVAILYGIGATLVGAYLPALEASRVPPLSALRPNRAVEAKDLPVKRLLIFGLVALLLAVLFSWKALTTGPAWVSFLACLSLAIGASLSTPWICRWLAYWASRWNKGQSHTAMLVRLASDNLGRSLHRSAVTVAALMMAVSMTIGVTVMVSSFRNTIDLWINQAMKADVYVTAAASEVLGFQAFLPPEIVAYLETRSDVTSIETYRQSMIHLQDGTHFMLGAVGNPARKTLRFIGGEGDRKVEMFEKPGYALATESLALKLDLKEGSLLKLPTPAGEREFTIAGVYYDYSDDRGKLVLTKEEYKEHWGDERIHSFSVFLNDPAAAPEVHEELQDRFSDKGELAIYSNQTIRERIFEVFDQTFAVTYVLRSIAILVAIFGVSLSLATLVMERTRDIGIFRAIGASRGQVRMVYLVEAGFTGLFGSLIGIACGLGMAVILTLVVNKSFFGWTIQLQVPWAEVWATPLWLVPVAILAGLIPASSAARIEVSEAVRGE
ncbi:MAG: FtsX-like permease family protein, partial [Verrucomicrobiota bacterium]